MREEIWHSLLLATLNALYFKRRAQRAHRIGWWLGLCSTALGAGSVIGVAARNSPDWLWPIFAVAASVLVVVNNQLAKDDEKALCARAAIEWDSAAEEWNAFWLRAKNDEAYQPTEQELATLRSRITDAKKIAPHLPESKRLIAQAWTESLRLRGAE